MLFQDTYMYIVHYTVVGCFYYQFLRLQLEVFNNFEWLGKATHDLIGLSSLTVHEWYHVKCMSKSKVHHNTCFGANIFLRMLIYWSSTMDPLVYVFIKSINQLRSYFVIDVNDLLNPCVNNIPVILFSDNKSLIHNHLNTS